MFPNKKTFYKPQLLPQLQASLSNRIVSAANNQV
jgi:hypothetical protein